MSRFTTTTFVTASVPATSFLNHNEVIGASNINIHKIKVVPSIAGVTSEAQLYEKDTFLSANRVWGTNPFTGTAFDPIQKDSAGVITEANRGFVVPYEDIDASGEFHIKLVNNDSQAKTFTVTVEWEEVSIAPVSVSGTPVDNQLAIWKSATSIEGDANLKWDGATFTVSGLYGGEVKLTGAGNNSAVNIEDNIGGIKIATINSTANSYGSIICEGWESGTGGDGSYIKFLTVGNNDHSIIFGTYAAGSTTDRLTIDGGGNLTVTGTGPHTFGGAVSGSFQVQLTGSYTATGTSARKFGVNGILTTSSGATSANYVHIAPQINTFAAADTYGIIASLRVGEPQLTLGGASAVTDTATIHIVGAATEGTRNNSLLVSAGSVRIGAVGTNDGHVHILSPSTGTKALIVEAASGATQNVFEVQHGGAQFASIIVGTNSNSIRMIDVDLGDDVAGSVLGIGRNTNANANSGSIKFTDVGGTAQHIWVDNSGDPGDVRVNSGAGPGGATTDTAGSIIGDQTSWHQLKQNIVEFTDYQAALDKIVSTKLYSFDFKTDHYDSALVIKKPGVWYSYNDKWDQVPSLKMREIIGTLLGSIKALEAKVKTLEAA